MESAQRKRAAAAAADAQIIIKENMKKEKCPEHVQISCGF